LHDLQKTRQHDLQNESHARLGKRGGPKTATACVGSWTRAEREAQVVGAAAGQEACVGSWTRAEREAQVVGDAAGQEASLGME